MKQELEKNELTFRPYRQENYLYLDIPGDLLPGLDRESRMRTVTVLEAVGQIKVIEYTGGPGQYNVTVIQGMHGEETKKINGATLAVEELDKSLQKSLADITGHVTLIPNANAPGCAFRTDGQSDPKRWVFPDETIRADKKVHNLNNVFDKFKTGDWEEFKRLGEEPLPKTAMYGWLLMKFLDDGRQTHERVSAGYGIDFPKSVIFDLHRNDRVTMPTVFIDWFKENKSLVNRLIGEAKAIEIPRFLEGDYWEAQRMFETLTAVASQRGFYAYTFEDTNMYDPDPNLSFFTALQIESYLARSGVLKFRENAAFAREMRLAEILKSSPVLERAVELARSQNEKNYIHQIYSGGEITNASGHQLNEREFLNKLTEDRYEGVVRIRYRPDAIGRMGTGRKIIIGEGLFGRDIGDFEKPDFYITVSELVPDKQIISLQESPFRMPYVEFGIYLADGALEARPLEPETLSLRLKPVELREKATDQTLQIDFWNLIAAIAKIDDRI